MTEPITIDLLANKIPYLSDLHAQVKAEMQGIEVGSKAYKMTEHMLHFKYGIRVAQMTPEDQV